MKNNYKAVREKLQRGMNLTALFLNDVGFQYGAGIAHFRQIQSFLLMGHDAVGVCWRQGPEEGSLPIVPAGASGKWLGMIELPYVHEERGLKTNDMVRAICEEVKTIRPDVVIVGNLHAARWPLELLLAIRDLDTLVVAYMHDCYLLSGGCAYSGDCRRYIDGCDDRCTTIHEYPKRNRSEITDAWKLRRQIFCGPDGIPIAANSSWVVRMARSALHDVHHIALVYLGLDETLFSPLDKKLTRKILGITDDRLVILGGSVNVSDRRKGGHIFEKIVETFSDEALFVVFGAQSSGLRGVKATGLLRDSRKMALLYNAADIFLGTALEEAFGQTLCEAAACSVPIVAFNVGGVPEVARHDINARLADTISADAIMNELRYLKESPDVRAKLGRAGRALVESEFTLKRQGERWMEYLMSVTDPGRPET